MTNSPQLVVGGACLIFGVLAAPCSNASAQQSARADEKSIAVAAGRDVNLTVNDLTTIKQALPEVVRAELERHAPGLHEQLAVVQGLLGNMSEVFDATGRRSAEQLQHLQRAFEQWTEAFKQAELELKGEQLRQAEALLRQGNVAETRSLLSAEKYNTAGTWVFVPGAIVTALGIGGAVLFWTLGESAVGTMQAACPPGRCDAEAAQRAVESSRIGLYDGATNVSLVAGAVGIAGMIVGGILWTASPEHRVKQSQAARLRLQFNVSGLSAVGVF